MSEYSDNEIKRNWGPFNSGEKVMNELVDQSQEIIRLKDEIGELKEKLALEYCKAVSRGLFIASDIESTNEKAKAWDDLNEFISCMRNDDMSIIDIQFQALRKISELAIKGES